MDASSSDWTEKTHLLYFLAAMPVALLTIGFIIESVARFRLRGRPCEVLISRRAIYCTGKFLMIDGLGVSVNSSQVIEGEIPMLLVGVTRRFLIKKSKEPIYIPLTEQQACTISVVVSDLVGSDTTLGRLADLLDFGLQSLED